MKGVREWKTTVQFDFKSRDDFLVVLHDLQYIHRLLKSVRAHSMSWNSLRTREDKGLKEKQRHQKSNHCLG